MFDIHTDESIQLWVENHKLWAYTILKLMPTNTEHWKLCYIEDSLAYFTALSIDKQWGDDWDDAPYQWNAEPPYGDKDNIYILAFQCTLATPAQCGLSVSVQDINKGTVPWLSDKSYTTGVNIPVVYAGCSLDEFINVIHKTGGIIYLPIPVNE